MLLAHLARSTESRQPQYDASLAFQSPPDTNTAMWRTRDTSTSAADGTGTTLKNSHSWQGMPVISIKYTKNRATAIHAMIGHIDCIDSSPLLSRNMGFMPHNVCMDSASFCG